MCLDNCLFVTILSWGLIWSVLSIVYSSPLCHGYSLRGSWQSYICLHYVMDSHCECLDNGLFVSIMSWILIAGVLTIVYLAPFLSWVLIAGILTIVYLSHYVMSTYWDCLDNRLLISSMSLVLIGGVLTIVHLSPLCHGYTFGVFWQLSFCLHYGKSTYWVCLVYCLFVSIMSWVFIGGVLIIGRLSPFCHGYSLGVPWQLSFCLHYVTVTHWGCIAKLLIVYLSPLCQLYSLQVLCIVYMSPVCQGYSLAVSFPLPICLHDVTGTHLKCFVNHLSIFMVPPVLFVSVLSIPCLGGNAVAQ